MTRPYQSALLALAESRESLETEIATYERRERKSGQFPSVHPAASHSVSSGPDKVTFRALLIELEVNLAGRENREDVIARGMATLRQQLEDRLAKCDTIDIDEDDEQPTVRWSKVV